MTFFNLHAHVFKNLPMSLQNSGFMISAVGVRPMLVLNGLCFFFYRVTDERLLVGCCSRVAEWLVTAEDGDSVAVDIPNGMCLRQTGLLIERLRLPLRLGEMCNTPVRHTWDAHLPSFWRNENISGTVCVLQYCVPLYTMV